MKGSFMKKIRLGLAALVFSLCSPCFSGIATAEEESNWYDSFSFTGYLDTRFQYSSFSPNVSGADKTSASDIRVWEAAISPGVRVSDYVDVTAVFYYVDGSNKDHTGRSESLTVDEFYLLLHYGFDDGKNGQVWFKAGKYYPPVGNFTTFGIGYTRPQDLFWTRVSAAGFGYDHRFGGLSFHAFNGDFDRMKTKNGKPDPADDTVDSFAAAIRVSPLAFSDDQRLDIGAYFLSDVAETLNPIESMFAENLLVDDGGTPNDASDDTMGVLYKKDVPLYGAYLVGNFTITDMFGIGLAAEYATTGKFDRDYYLDAAGDETALTATNAEAALLLHGKRVQIGGRFGSIRGMDWLGAAVLDPDFKPTDYTQLGGFIGCDYVPGIHIAVQYLSGVDNESNADSLAEVQAKVVF
jgi:hypothetical protein